MNRLSFVSLIVEAAAVVAAIRPSWAARKDSVRMQMLNGSEVPAWTGGLVQQLDDAYMSAFESGSFSQGGLTRADLRDRTYLFRRAERWRADEARGVAECYRVRVAGPIPSGWLGDVGAFGTRPFVTLLGRERSSPTFTWVFTSYGTAGPLDASLGRFSWCWIAEGERWPPGAAGSVYGNTFADQFRSLGVPL